METTGILILIITLSEKEVKEAIIAHLGSLADNNAEFLNVLDDMKLDIKPKTDTIGAIIGYDFMLTE